MKGGNKMWMTRGEFLFMAAFFGVVGFIVGMAVGCW
jgi:hypothetical protein